MVEVEAWLARSARTHPDRVAVRAAEGAPTYVQLHAQAQTAARRLAARGVQRGDRVALALPSGLGFVVALHGVLALGAVAVPIDLRLGAAERARRAAGCAVVLDAPPAGPEDRAAVLPATHDLAAPAVIVHTSGTTAAARPVALTYRNWLWSALGSAVALGLDPEERWLCALPLSHVGGLSILLRSAIYATTAILHERFDADAVAAELARGDATLVSVVPTTLGRLLDAGLREPPALRAALVGGGPIAPALLHRAAAAAVPTVTTYGLTEACSQVTTGGPPLFCTRVRIDAPDARGQGEILVAGPTVAHGAAGPDGWLRTGDLGRLDAAGELWVTGRTADTIVTGGENVAPAEVEAALAAHPAVAEVAVHGWPDSEWGEAVHATIVLRPGAREPAADELRAHCRARLADFQVPKGFSFRAELPKTPSGKVLRRNL